MSKPKVQIQTLKGLKAKSQDASEIEALHDAIRALEVIDEVDTAFEVIRISWDNPTPQAVVSINGPWKKIAILLDGHGYCSEMQKG